MALFSLLGAAVEPACAALAPASVPAFQLRFRVTAAPQPIAASTRFILRGSAGGTIVSTGRQWSGWMPVAAAQIAKVLARYPNTALKTYPVVMKLQLGNARPTTTVELEARLAQTGQTLHMHADLTGPTLGILIWRDGDGRPSVGTMADYNRAMIWDALPAHFASQAPKRFTIVDRFIGGSDDAIEWREGIAHLAHDGLNAMLLPPTAAMRAMLLRAGVRQTGWAVYSPPGYTFAFPYMHYDMRKQPDAAGKTTDQILAAWAHGLAEPLLAAGYSAQDVAVYNIADEPGWYYPDALNALRADADGMARFHRYLQAHGLKPADFGARTWAAVQPIGRSGATTPATRKLFYWTMRFFPWDSANYFAAVTRALDKAFLPGIPDPVNWSMFNGRSYVPGPVDNNRFKDSPDAAMGAHDWFEFARLHGSNMLWTEDWFGDRDAFKWSFYAARLGPAARRAGIKWGGYVVPRTSGQTPYGLMQKVLSIAGNGGKAVEYFVFGPEYNFPGNTYSTRAAVILPEMARVHRMLAQAEDLLVPGQKPKAEVAILQPRSSEMWDPVGISGAADSHFMSHTVAYMAETYGLYRALQQQDIPADFVAEDALTPAALAGYKVLYVTEPDFPKEFVPALLQWVRRGGTVVTVSGALEADRYDVPMATFQQARGIVEARRSRLLVASVDQLPMVASLDGDWHIVGVKGHISQSRGDVVARFKDGSPAIIRRKSGRGAFIHYAFLPGVSAYATRNHRDGEFSHTALEWVSYPVRAARVQPPASVDHMNVETPILLSRDGAAITLLNWTGAKLATLAVTAHVPFTVKSATSVSRGPLHFSQSGGVVSFALPLQGADIVLLRR